MTYISPLHIIKGLSEEDDFEINDANLIRLRKRLLAELNLSGEATLTVHQKTYSKDEIIKTIDLLLGNPDLELHRFIDQHAFLHSYLENETLTLNTDLYRTLEIPETIKSKLETLASERFMTQFKKAISTRQFSMAEQSLVLIKTLSGNLREACYEDVHRSLYTLHTYLYEIENTMSLYHKDDIKFLGSQSFGLFLNRLPEGFEDIKHDLINRVINIVVAYHKLKGHDTNVVERMSIVLTKLDCEEEQARLIKNNHKVFSASTSSSSSFDYSYLRYIGIAIIILVNVFRSCNTNKPTQFNNDIKSFSTYSAHEFETVPTKLSVTFDQQFEAYRREVSSRVNSPNNESMQALFDRTDRKTGDDPFLTGFKASSIGITSAWEDTILVKNKTDHQVIIFCFDSLKTKFKATYIKQGEETTIAVTNHLRMAFYFGNILLSVDASYNKGNTLPYFYEYFEKTPSSSIQLLNTDYEISLKRYRRKTVKRYYTLNIQPEFLEEVKDHYAFEKLDLKKVSH